MALRLISEFQHSSTADQAARMSDLLQVTPRGATVLDVGAFAGRFSIPLADRFDRVTALDLMEPPIAHPRVTPVVGDITKLQFPDGSFDCVFCSEVLEHIPDLETAVRELVRVSRKHIVVGVPFEQDTRVDRTSCPNCRAVLPPWGHVWSFGEKRLLGLFRDCRLVHKSFVGVTRERTNALSAWLMEIAGHPWGAYAATQFCDHCGAALTPPARRSFFSRVCSSIAVRLRRIQNRFSRPRPKWIHLVFEK